MTRSSAAILALLIFIIFGQSLVLSDPIQVEGVSISGCDNQSICSTIQHSILSILNGIDDIDSISDNFTADGLFCFEQLQKATQFFCVNVLYDMNLVHLSDGGYEVRGVRVRVNMGRTKGNPDQYIVFTFDDHLLVSDVHFAIENHYYERIIDDGRKLEDFSNRQKILHFIEIFRTAYNKKDIAFLKRVYSDDALIIVGRVLKVDPEHSDMLQQSLLTKDQIRFVKFSKTQYLSNLEKVFQFNDFVKVDFEDIEIMRHDSIQDIYGVTLKQKWQSSSYSDEGYLFLMIDFMDPDRPFIHVRTWQSEKFPDGSVISLYDFNIID